MYARVGSSPISRITTYIESGFYLVEAAFFFSFTLEEGGKWFERGTNSAEGALEKEFYDLVEWTGSFHPDQFDPSNGIDLAFNG